MVTKAVSFRLSAFSQRNSSQHFALGSVTHGDFESELFVTES